MFNQLAFNIDYDLTPPPPTLNQTKTTLGGGGIEGRSKTKIPYPKTPPQLAIKG